MKKRIILIVLATITIAIVVVISLAANFFYEASNYREVLAKPEKEIEVVAVPTTLSAIITTKAATGINQADSTDDTAQVIAQYRQELQGKNIVSFLFLGIDKTVEREETLKIYRSDTIVLALVNLDTKKVHLLSIPRDTYAYLPVTGRMDKINHAYAYGGMNEKGIISTMEAVKELTKFPDIDYYFSLDMEPIPEIVDSLGGIELDVDCAMQDEEVKLKKGFQMLNGRQTFTYIHWRYSANGDIDRIKRQQKFAKAMIHKLKENDQLLKAVEIVLSYKDNIQTNLTTKQIVALANLMKGLTSEDITFYNVPGRGEYIKKISYWQPDKKAFQKILTDDFIKMK